MANPLRGETTFQVGEGESRKTFRVVFDWNAAAAFEGVSGRQISDVLRDLATGVFSATWARGLLWAGLRRHHPKVSVAACGRIMDQLGRERTLDVVRTGMHYFFPELDEDKADADPPNPATSA